MNRLFPPLQPYASGMMDGGGHHRIYWEQSVKADGATWDLIDDIERWLVFGDSWGATLALAYAERHAERCTDLILRGVWLCTDEEIEWWLNGDLHAGDKQCDGVNAVVVGARQNRLG
jgi:pimeloyl-ACP methyl ester carboxylesterase